MNSQITNAKTRECQALSRDHHLPPFTDYKQLNEKGARIITKAEGVYIWDSEGNKILDAMAGLWCVNVGYGREELVQAATRQMRELPFYNLFFQTAHPPVVELAKAIADVAPEGKNHVFFTGSGSECADTSIKMARAYWRLKGQPQKTKLIGRARGYHGVNVAGTRLGGIGGNRKMFGQLMDVDHLPHTLQPGMAFTRGMAQTGGVALATALLKLLAVLALGVGGLHFGWNHGFANDFRLASIVPSSPGQMAALGVMVYGIMGTELACCSAAEMRNARRDIPRAVLISGLIVGAFNIFGTLGVLAAVPAEEPDVTRIFAHTLYNIYGHDGAGGMLADLVGAFVLFTLFTNMVTWSMGTNRAAVEAAKAGELPVAYIQLKPGASASEEELLEHASRHVPERAAVPKDIWLIESMPVTAVGKTFKPALRLDAIRRVLEEESRRIAEDIRVEVVADERHGQLAHLHVPALDERRQAALEELLGGYALNYRLHAV